MKSTAEVIIAVVVVVVVVVEVVEVVEVVGVVVVIISKGRHSSRSSELSNDFLTTTFYYLLLRLQPCALPCMCTYYRCRVLLPLSGAIFQIYLVDLPLPDRHVYFFCHITSCKLIVFLFVLFCQTHTPVRRWSQLRVDVQPLRRRRDHVQRAAQRA